jgi:fructose-1,6-bisphosphatase I
MDDKNSAAERSELPDRIRLDSFLADWATGDPLRGAVAATLVALADAAKAVAALIADGPLLGGKGGAVGDNVQGEVQKLLDVEANDLFLAAARRAPVAGFASEELDHPVALDPAAPLLIAIDPLDGSSNIDTNVSIGTIFSILPRPPAGQPAADEAAFLQRGRHQLAAGYAIYGPATAFVLTVGAGTHAFTLDRRTGSFVLTARGLAVARQTREFAINASNLRHWDEPIRIYVEDCLAGRDGVRGEDFNMRWVASLVAECHRILVRGGVFLYPSDARATHREGRLRLLYEANPVALLIEAAGGEATTGTEPILDVEPGRLHQRVALIFGSADEIERIAHHHDYPHVPAGSAVLVPRPG